jgi:hypothetical protein
MNRTLMFGIAIFFAVLGIALVGGEQQAVAGHGCHGGLFGGRCNGGGLFANKGCRGLFGGHHARKRCGGGLFARLHARKCNGYGNGCNGVSDCCGAPAPSCCGVPEPTCCAPQPSCCGVPVDCSGAPVEGIEMAPPDAPVEGDVVPEAPEAPDAATAPPAQSIISG